MAQTNVQAFSGDVEISSNLAVNTDDLFVDTESGRVGIGTTNPGSALEVFSTAGTQLILRSDSRYSSIFAVDDTGSSFFGNDRGAIRFVTGGDTSGSGASEKMRILSNGNVGIGVTLPQGKLQVVSPLSNIEATDLDSLRSNAAINIMAYGDSNDNLSIGLLGTSTNTGNNPSAYIQNRWDAGVVADLLLQPAGGNVGIGTTNPTGFEVYNKSINQKYREDFTNIHVNNKYQIDSRDGAAPNTLSQRYGVRAADNAGLNPEIGELIIGAHADQNDISSDATFLSFNDSGYFYIATHPTANYGEDVTLGPNESFPYIGTDTENRISPLFTVRSSGTVGIGTTTPAEKLDVQGSAVITGLTYGIKSTGTLVSNRTEDWYRLLIGGIRNGGNGIRTKCKLQLLASGLHQTLTFDFNHMIDLSQTSGNTFNLLANDHFINRVGIIKLRLADAGSNQIALDMYIDHDIVPLDRDWTITLYTEGGSIISEASPFLQKITAAPTTSIEISTQTSIFGIVGSTTSKTLVMRENGRIGIGTTSPSGPLHVYGDANETNAQLRIESADRYSGVIFHDDGGGIQMGADNGTLRILTDYAADLTGGVEVARITGNELKLKAERNSRIFIEDTGTDAGTYYQGLYIGSPVGDTDAGMRMVVTHDSNTSGNRKNIIGFTNRDLEFCSFSDNDTTSGFGTRVMSFSSSGDVSIPDGILNITDNATRSRVMRLGVTSGGTGIGFHMGTGGGGDWAATGIPMTVNNSGGGTILFVFNINRGGADATNSQVFVIRKRYDGGSNWTSTSTTVKSLAYLAGTGGAGTLYFRESGNYLQYKFDQGGNAHFYALEFD